MPDSFDPHGGQMRCPNCRARQDWADECRRCRCDFTLLRAAAEACRQSRRRCLVSLRAGRGADALTHARRYFALDPGDDAGRLLAVCALLAGNWPLALTAAQAVRDD